jgi:Uma2 family endonuclease
MTSGLQSPTKALMTAEEFAQKHGGDYVELIDGEVKELPVPFNKHGKICNWASFYITQFALAHDLGHVTSNDSFVKTKIQPDRVRGADVCYFSYERLPKGPMPEGLLAVSPDLVVEVCSPSDDRDEVQQKAFEYLSAQVRAVVVLDPKLNIATVYRKDEIQQVFDNGDELVLPDVLPGFSVPVRKFFE